LEGDTKGDGGNNEKEMLIIIKKIRHFLKSPFEKKTLPIFKMRAIYTKCYTISLSQFFFPICFVILFLFQYFFTNYFLTTPLEITLQ